MKRKPIAERIYRLGVTRIMKNEPNKAISAIPHTTNFQPSSHVEL